MEAYASKFKKFKCKVTEYDWRTATWLGGY